MSAQHSPGPWRYDLHRDDDGTTLDLATVDVDAGPDGRPTDYGSTLLEGGYLVRETDAENDANARLLAASPLLLEALHDLRAILRPAEAASFPWAERAIARIDAAIADATGDERHDLGDGEAAP